LHDCLRLLLSAKAIQEEDSSLLQWEFHDLLFHTRSRSGRHANPSGGIYPFKGKIPPLVANKAVSSTLQIPLYRPDIEKLKKEDSPFALVVESRSSKRAHDNSNPISIQQLGEFLFRAARIKKMFPGGLQELSSRPYPSGGALYELEIYPLIYHCKGVERGLYHYDPYLHQLSLVTMNNDMLEALLQSSASSADRNSHPQILFIISSRFQRRSWKYCSIAYATSLKNVGILFQNMYLVGTAMNLATSAIGLGNSDLFAKVIGSNYYEETSLGEFILGTQESYATI
jgi:oxazoline/thiazoline dehydrogenase